MIDLYCERLGPGLWAEPINALTNLSFVIAAIATWHLANHLKSLSPGIFLLIGLMVSIGIGSGFFHTFATNWARVLDVIPILMFQIAYLYIYGRQIINMRTSHLTGAVALFLVAAYFGRQSPQLLNGSLIYAPAFVLLLVLGIYHYRHARKQRPLLLWASGVFLLSLFFRTIDQAACAYVPIGTHFIWHIFNGVLVYLAAHAILVNLQVPGEKNCK